MVQMDNAQSSNVQVKMAYFFEGQILFNQHIKLQTSTFLIKVEHKIHIFRIRNETLANV